MHVSIPSRADRIVQTILWPVPWPNAWDVDVGDWQRVWYQRRGRRGRRSAARARLCIACLLLDRPHCRSVGVAGDAMMIVVLELNFVDCGDVVVGGESDGINVRRYCGCGL